MSKSKEKKHLKWGIRVGTFLLLITNLASSWINIRISQKANKIPTNHVTTSIFKLTHLAESTINNLLSGIYNKCNILYSISGNSGQWQMSYLKFYFSESNSTWIFDTILDNGKCPIWYLIFLRFIQLGYLIQRLQKYPQKLVDSSTCQCCNESWL